MKSTITFFCSLLLLSVYSSPILAAEEALIGELQQLETVVLNKETVANPRSMLSDDIRARRSEINRQDVLAWRAIKTKEDWERHRAKALSALKESLGSFPDMEPVNVQVARTIRGDGYAIDCVVFESRPGIHVTANLYRPLKLRPSMPGILICHSHHNPKTQSELQDMGVVWARAGCYVLVMDQLGHGERRQHPFRTSADYDESFKVSRQDYYFRYNVGIQLHLIGESLIGWMAADLMRGVDVLLHQPNVDPKRIALLGAVAGGGDPVAVTAALDPRIMAVVPFNFGGPQPETTFPLPEDAELKFNYVGGGSWESTRNLQDSASGGFPFLPWTIVAASAPRRLIYAHEFSWDKASDPVWKRLETIFQLYDQRDHLSSLKGYGRVTLSSNEASHCNNIGKHHRTQIHPAFKEWFDIDVDDDFSERRDSKELLCFGADNHEAAEILDMRGPALKIADRHLSELRAEKQRAGHLDAWSSVLGGDVGRRVAGKVVQDKLEVTSHLRVYRFALNPRREIHIPGLLLLPKAKGKPNSVVLAIAQSGKQRLLVERSAAIAQLLDAGVGVCLVDLPGTGETRSGDYRGRRSNDTGLSSNELMLGSPLLSSRLRDTLVVVDWLKSRPDVDSRSIGIWGESLARLNGDDRPVDVPLGVDKEPYHSEPMGATVAMLAGMFDEDVRAVLARGGLVSFRSVLESQFVHIPHDYVVPGLLKAGDVADIAAMIAPRPLRVDGLVDGTNRRATSTGTWPQDEGQTVNLEPTPLKESVAWLVKSLKN